MTLKSLSTQMIDVAIQDIGDALSTIGRLRIAGDRLDGTYWGHAIQLLQSAAQRLHKASGQPSSAPEGSKLNPGKDDCYTEALPDEPIFVLLARDDSAPELVEAWATRRLSDITKCVRPPEDREKVTRAVALATKMRHWREERYGAWRIPEKAENTQKPA